MFVVFELCSNMIELEPEPILSFTGFGSNTFYGFFRFLSCNGKQRPLETRLRHPGEELNPMHGQRVQVRGMAKRLKVALINSIN